MTLMPMLEVVLAPIRHLSRPPVPPATSTPSKSMVALTNVPEATLTRVEYMMEGVAQTAPTPDHMTLTEVTAALALNACLLPVNWKTACVGGWLMDMPNCITAEALVAPETVHITWPWML